MFTQSIACYNTHFVKHFLFNFGKLNTNFENVI